MWGTDRLGAVVVHDANDQGTGSVLNLISEISEEVCSQLHAGIMKTARKVLLDEIVSGTISDFLATKKYHQNQKVGRILESAKSVSSCGKMVSTCRLNKYDCFHKPCNICFGFCAVCKK